jgi:hypothetical protein
MASSPGETMNLDPSPIATTIDLDRYPIAPLGDARAQALAGACRAQLADTGSCLLPGFLRPDAVARMAEEAAAIAPLAHRKPGGRGATAYLAPPDESFPEDHPRRRLQTSSVGAVAYDLLPRGNLVRALYEWDGLLEFLAASLGKDRLYRYADPLGALNIASMGDGEHLLWHFDQTDFVVSILLQDCERGGDFEYVPNIRDAETENYDRVRRLLDGDRSEVVRLDMAPGTLALFMGRHSIHRVTPIAGPRLRLIALLGYDTEPGTMSSDRLKLARYGRTEPIAAVV